MTDDLWAIEKSVSDIFVACADAVGFWEADRFFDEYGLNEDSTDDDKVQRAVEVARKLGVTLCQE